MLSPQTLTEPHRRLVAGWAADCAEHVLPLFETACPGDGRVHASIARTRAFARGELDISEEIRRRFAGSEVARGLKSKAAAAAARSAGQAAAVSHMGAHALGAAAYAAQAAGLAASTGAEAAIDAEIDWQLSGMSPEIRAALRLLPPAGADRAGPLGPGLLTSGDLGDIVRRLQRRIASAT